MSYANLHHIKSPYGFVEDIFDKLKFPEPRKYAFAVVHESYSIFDDYYHLRDKGRKFDGGDYRCDKEKLADIEKHRYDDTDDGDDFCDTDDADE